MRSKNDDIHLLPQPSSPRKLIMEAIQD